MADKRNMTVAITLMVDFTQDSNGQWTASGNYSGTSIPPAKPGQTVVDSKGKIDLKAIDRDNKLYTNDSNIYFYLGSSSGHTCHFPYDPANPANADLALEIDDKKDKDKYTASLGDTDHWFLSLLDQDDNGDEANYRVYVQLMPDGMGGNGIRLPIDPVIINRDKRD
ncbi:hypothetical protein [Sphingomicrobium flavum]|uniref:hypothetical protein n=1 Tax=Sphingomicrobium flavum TaxID=1229164 RepID=UPI0021ADFEA8|nr:hypothetical protein [Sphingomicrobium flavum]